jgi:hypothetical protein
VPASVTGQVDGAVDGSDIDHGAPRSITLPPPRAAAARSTIMKKAAMAVTGLILVLYLLAHMYGNLMVFAGRKASRYQHQRHSTPSPEPPCHRRRVRDYGRLLGSAVHHSVRMGRRQVKITLRIWRQQ